MTDPARRLAAAILVLVSAWMTACGVSPRTPATPPAAQPTSLSVPSSSAAASTVAAAATPTSAPTEAPSRPAASTVPPAPPSNPTTVPIATPSPLPEDAAKLLPAAPTGSRGVVYLTFDDGPSQFTRSVLAILDKTDSTATFFELGVNQLTYPKAVKAVRHQGSAVGNHTYDHADLTTLTDRQVRSELRRGPKHTTCARPPYGATDARVHRLLTRAGLQQVQWSDDTIDWSRPGARAIYLRATSAHVVNGSIVLMHDGGGDRTQTVAAVPKIIAELQRRGYLIRRLPGC
jgi:peptidoglycan-N-acetylglucosamine deacetylase